MDNQKSPRKRKLFFQISVILIPIFLAVTAGVLWLFYESSVNSFLKAQESYMENIINSAYANMFYEFGEEVYGTKPLDYILTYCEDYPENVQDSLTEEEFNTYTWYAGDMSLLGSSEEIDRSFVKMELSSILSYFESEYNSLAVSNCSQAFLMDTSEGHEGMVLYEYKKQGDAKKIGEMFDYTFSEHPKIKDMIDSGADQIVFEKTKDFPMQGNYYVGYKPVIIDGKVRAVVGISFEWDDIRISVMKTIGRAGLVTAAGLLLVILLMQGIIYRRVIVPVQNIQVAVRNYTDSKDSKAAVSSLAEIREANEIGLLSGDISELVRKIEEYNDKNSKLTKDVVHALASAIDAKDKYTRGHSARVAEYSRRIAEHAGKSKKECNEVYYAALLHDVGKIGIPEGIINKKGRLTDEEFETIKQHPVLGAMILENIKESPYLRIGARYHHERYDGKGYPDHLKGEEIPEIARIVSVADAYDAMTSLRSYRGPIPQQQVREEIVKGSGTQFDPEFAKIMLHLIDLDIEYKMIEWSENLAERTSRRLVIDSHRSEVSVGTLLTNHLTAVNIRITPFDRATGVAARPSIILYDALDGQIHSAESEIRDLEYMEYGEIWFDGNTKVISARKIQTKTIDQGCGIPDEYRIEAARVKDHAIIRIIGETQTNEVIIALPDSTRFAHIAFTGEHCIIEDVRIEQTETGITEDMIPRIAEEISYINVPAGDIPNVQIDGYRTDASQGIPVEDGMEITFHAVSLPTARLVWHCPFLNVFGADDGRVFGVNYRDYMLMRLDGECWEENPGCTVTAEHSRNGDFVSWDEWKARSKAGFDCTFSFERKDNIITVRTENGGVSIQATAEINDGNEMIYAAVTGDQVAITNIRIKKQVAENIAPTD